MEQKKLDLEQFIKDNNIDLTQTGSNLNGQCVVLSGFALYLGMDFNDVDNVVKEMFPEASYFDELERVFNYADSHNYSSYWKTDQAKQMYKF